MKNQRTYQNKTYLDKKDLYEHQIDLLQRIVDSSDTNQLIETFESAAEKPIRLKKHAPFAVAKRVKDLNKDCAGNWTAKNVRNICAQNFDTWYNTAVKDKTRKEFDTYFHKSAKRSAKYECRKGILDMTDGPIISEEQWKLLQEDETNIEVITPATSEKEIRNLQKLYQRKQFGHDRGLIYRSGDRVHVTH